ncbi:124_t:CDS:1, partial [Funneliformis geosporum]
MEKLKVRKVLGVSINPYLYEKLKEECSGKNVSAFVERAITK